VSKTISVAVVIPSFNGAHKVLNVLNALEKQTYKDFRVILVIDGSTDRTAALVERFRPQLDLLVVQQKNKGRAASRNAGAANCTEDIIVFLDDDMRPEPNCLEHHIHHHLKYIGTALSGNQIEDPLKAKTDFQKYKAKRASGWMNTYPNHLIKMENNNLFFTSANCSIPREIFNHFEGFDERLKDAEDFDLSARMLTAGIDIYLDPKCLGWHDDYISLSKYIKRQREYRKAWLKLIELKPDLLKNFNRFSPNPQSSFKALFFKIFAFKKWIHLIDKTKVLLLLPEIVRFRIYDYVVASLGKFNTHIKI
jgi:glycosyltransferase involved in cell wall biosynthesis